MRRSFARRRLVAAVTVVMTALALAACGSSSNSSSSASSGSGGGGSSSSSGGGGGGTIGFSIPQGSNPALQALNAGLTAEAQKQGYQVRTTDANLDPNKQISDLQAFIQQHVKALVVWPLDDHAVPYYTDLLLDGKGVGNNAAHWFAQNVGPHANVAAILGPPQVDQFLQIAQGWQDGVKQTGINQLSSQVDPKLAPTDAVNITSDFKTRYGSKLQGLFVTLESQAIALSAVVNSSFKPKITTYGGTDACLDALKSGLVSVCYYQNPTLMGRIAGWAAGQAIAGKTIPKQLHLTMPTITQQNVGSYPKAKAQLTLPYTFKPVQQNGEWVMPGFQ
jgi:ABC-type sugar transport system substrate-binding protein